MFLFKRCFTFCCNSSKLEEMVLNHISSILRQAKMTFTCNNEAFRSNLDILKHLLDKTTASDVNLHPQFMTESLWLKPDKAPVTYIGIYENELLTMGIFVLSPEMKLPLHDHPQMYGLIKVLAGKIKVTSFTLNDDPSNVYTSTSSLVFPAEKHPEELLDAKSETCVLDPRQRNIHEIQSVDGPAAFLDILSPPYCSRDNPSNSRKCTYFKISEHLSGRLYKLHEINPPKWYWNDTYLYEGPEIVQQKKTFI